MGGVWYILLVANRAPGACRHLFPCGVESEDPAHVEVSVPLLSNSRGGVSGSTLWGALGGHHALHPEAGTN